MVATNAGKLRFKKISHCRKYGKRISLKAFNGNRARICKTAKPSLIRGTLSLPPSFFFLSLSLSPACARSLSTVGVSFASVKYATMRSLRGAQVYFFRYSDLHFLPRVGSIYTIRYIFNGWDNNSRVLARPPRVPAIYFAILRFRSKLNRYTVHNRHPRNFSLPLLPLCTTTIKLRTYATCAHTRRVWTNR